MSGESVLVIDDSPTILKVVQLVLTKAGFDVSTASDGDEGVDKAKALNPHVILLDFVMPRMNGYQVCQALHQQGSLKEVPIILMSAKGDQVGERFVKVMGVVDYITKPFSPEAITGIVRHTIDKYRKSPVPSEAAQATPPFDPVIAKVAANEARQARTAALSSLRKELGKLGAAAVWEHVKGPESPPSTEEVATWIEGELSCEALEILLGKLRATAPELIGGAESTVLAGDLQVIPMAEVLLLLSQQQQTGSLLITRQTAHVELHFKEGRIDLATAVGVPQELRLGRFLLERELLTQQQLDQILSSRSDDSGLLGTELVEGGHVSRDELVLSIRTQTCELVYEMLRWNFGRFGFRTCDAPSPLSVDAALGLTVDGILMEGFRRVDEWHLIEKDIDNFDLVFLRNEDAVNRMGRGRLTREELAILELVNGKNTVKEIVRQSRMGSFEVTKMLYRLHSIKLIRKRVQPVAV